MGRSPLFNQIAHLGAVDRSYDFLEGKDRSREFFAIPFLDGVYHAGNVIDGDCPCSRLPFRLRVAGGGLNPRPVPGGPVLMGGKLALLLLQIDFPVLGRYLLFDLGNDALDQRVPVDISQADSLIDDRLLPIEHVPQVGLGVIF